LGLTDAELSLLLTDDDEIRELNAQFRQLDAPTDVLSFPLEDHVPTDGTWTGPLGDVVISLQTAARQAEAAEHQTRLAQTPGAAVADATAPPPDWSLDDETLFLLVHGVLHLLGHDHAEPDEEALMRREERRLFEAITTRRTPRRTSRPRHA
jgi:probable rRNA maturation factor